MSTSSKWWWAVGIAGIVAAVVVGWLYRDAVVKMIQPEEPTIDFGGGRVHFVAAQKRAVFVFHERVNAGFACPEPSPDVRENTERLVKAVVDVQGKAPKDASFASKQGLDANTKVVTDALMQRTQGLQVLRDMLFQACLANVRGDMSGLQYVNFISTTLPKLTTSLIATELVTRQETSAKPMSNADLQVFLNFLLLNAQ